MSLLRRLRFAGGVILVVVTDLVRIIRVIVARVAVALRITLFEAYM